MSAATLNQSSRKSDLLRRSSNTERLPASGTGERGNGPRQSNAADSPHTNRRVSARPRPIESASRSDQLNREAVRFSLPLVFLIIGYAVGFFLALISLLDLALGMPFYRASALYDAGLFVASVILLYLSHDARDGVRG
ncbi:hypothetical protein [Lacipirellula parvula]|uniref:Uncharacterized protein n=1 Tax=Lacipirellula parvula TaxID=2650471 RepID=A0A5K7XAC0_9BACT|nr:hypothetical protein [Lacipirellula parvula]BBO33375.1 hypothetical protein PLANPX_2987 [Lacipirellula parvula]